jgi:hypothetical protein
MRDLKDRCGACSKTPALFPAFLLANRHDVVEPVGMVINEGEGAPSGVPPVADRLGVPHSTACGWMRRFCDRALEQAGECPTNSSGTQQCRENDPHRRSH